MRQRRCTLDVAKKANPHVIAHKLSTTIARRRKRIDKGVTSSQVPQLKKASVDTGGIDLTALIDGSGIVLDKRKMIGESILQLHEGNAVYESIKSYEYDEYQPITGTQLNSAGQITLTIENQDQFLHLH